MSAFEADSFAGRIFYLTTLYKRSEIAFRLALFYGATTIAGAFSGLVAFGVFQIDHARVPGWKFVMIIEGSIAVLLAAFAVWWLPESAAKCTWLTEEEKAMARARTLQDSSKETDKKRDIECAVRRILNWGVMAYAILAFSYGTASSIVGNFLAALGGEVGVVESQDVTWMLLILSRSFNSPAFGFVEMQLLISCSVCLFMDASSYSDFSLIRSLPRALISTWLSL